MIFIKMALREKTKDRHYFRDRFWISAIISVILLIISCLHITLIVSGLWTYSDVTTRSERVNIRLMTITTAVAENSRVNISCVWLKSWIIITINHISNQGTNSLCTIDRISTNLPVYMEMLIGVSSQLKTRYLSHMYNSPGSIHVSLYQARMSR